MVAAEHVRLDPRPLEPGAQRRARHEVVNPPPDVSLARAGAVRPPAVVTRAFLKFAEGVDEARPEKIPKAGALLVGEARAADVLLRPGQVDLLVCHVEVAAKHHGLPLLQLLRVGQQRPVPGLAKIEARQLRLRVGHIDADHETVVKLRRERAALGVVGRRADPVRDRERLALHQQRRAAVPFLLGRIPGDLIALRPLDVLHIAGRGLHLLQADHVGVGRGHPIEQALAQRGAHTVDVPGEEFHAGR